MGLGERTKNAAIVNIVGFTAQYLVTNTTFLAKAGKQGVRRLRVFHSTGIRKAQDPIHDTGKQGGF